MVDRSRLLVTGATGTLGREVVAALEARGGMVVRTVSRQSQPVDLPAGREWQTADLTSDRLGPVVEGCDALIHLASVKGGGDADIIATRRLLEAAAEVGVQHAVVISIIGCDRIPLPYYASKVAIEAEVRASSVPWSVVRVAQFHSFVERIVSAASALPVPSPIVTDLRFQSVDEREAADVLVDVALGPPLGMAPEVAGPVVQTLGEIAAIWLDVTHTTARLLPITLDEMAASRADAPTPEPWAIAVLAGYRAGENTPQGERVLGTVGFAEWLGRHATLVVR